MLTNPGATRGFCQTVQWSPDSGAAVVVLINTDGDWEITDVGDQVLTLVAQAMRETAADKAAAE